MAEVKKESATCPCHRQWCAIPLYKHSEELVELRKESEKNQKLIEKNQQEIVVLRKESVDLRKESIKHEIHQAVLLKEILSISRRVGNLEDNR